MEEQANSATANAPRRITTSGVLALLNQGKSRKEIKEIFNVSNSELKVIFDSPSLKGKRTKKSRRTSFILEDDLSGQEARVVNPAPTPTPATPPAPTPTPTPVPAPESAPAVENVAPAPVQDEPVPTQAENVETSAPASRTARPSSAAIPVEAAQAAVPEIPVAKQEDEWGVVTEAVEEQPDDRPKFDL